MTQQTQNATALTLSQYNAIIANAISAERALQYAWVVAETADVRVAGPHCYLELVEKDPETGRPTARLRATIWASVRYPLFQKFRNGTGQDFRSDIKVMVCVTACYHPTFGLSANIVDINCAYTLGDVQRRRNQMIARLTQEGIIDHNRQLQWPLVPQRVAVVSAEGAAGYGDFMHQLLGNAARLRYITRLYPALMQGDKAAESVSAALDRVNEQADQWDCVVIIRGGGAGTDLLCFDNYDLAARIAQFPIPVIIGIGHERDITLLDYVANMRVKTPTAAAEWIVARGEAALAHLQLIASTMLRYVSEAINGYHQQLAYIAGQLPAAINNALTRADSRLTNARIIMAGICDRRLRPEMVKLDAYTLSLCQSARNALARQRMRLDGLAQLVDALSPQATLKRGYSITRVNGHAVTSTAQLQSGDTLTTVLADGTVTSRVM